MRLCLLLMLCAPGAFAAAKRPATEHRDVRAAESASFEAFHARQYPGAAAPAPVFDVTRPRGRQPWQLRARVDGPPQRLSPALCQFNQSHFSAQAQPRQPRQQLEWEESEPARRYVWLSRDPACPVPQRPVMLAPGLPVADVASLLQQHGELLTRARLLFAGNTECAWQRSLIFQLGALEMAAPAAGAPVMYGMVFVSDRGSEARVAVRKSRNEFTAWNVSCPKR